MNVTILFGGTNKERLVSVASAQALCQALPEAELWFWAADDSVHETDAKTLVAHERPFEQEFKPGGRLIGKSIEAALDQAGGRVLVLGLHGGRAENGELQAACEFRGVAYTGSGSTSSHLAFDKVSAKRFAAIAGVPVPANVALDQADAAFDTHGKLVAKPSHDG